MKTSAKKSKLREFARSSVPLESPEVGTESLGGPKSNLWSLQARLDIFERRQKGEDWETICKDYPTRTRHAMQQQYSVMKRQNAPDSPRFTSSSRRGRKTRGTGRNKWATVNKMHDSSEDGLDSDADLDIDIDDEDDEEYDSDEHAAEDDSHVAEEDIAINDGPRIKESVRASTLGRSLTDPSSHASIPRRATFPNLPGFAVPHAPNLEKKPSQPEPQKRKNETEATDSESRTSSHLSKRRKYSTEPSETFNHVSTDPPAPLKNLINGLNLTGIVLYPEAIAKANEDFRNLSLAYTAEKASRQETFEAAVKRATRRANDAEHKLQDSSQSYADKTKANDEAHNKIVEALRQEVTALTVSLTASRESLKTASESPPLRAVLQEKEARLARHDQLCLQLASEKEKLNQSQTRAALNASALEVRHEKLSKIIDKFLEGWEEVTMKIVKQFAMEMREESQAVKGLIEEEVREWKEIREMTDGLGNVVATIAGTETVNGVAESTTATALTTAAEPTTTTTTTEAAAAAVVEVAVTDEQPVVKSDGP